MTRFNDTDLTNLTPEGETSLTSPLLSIKAKTPFLSPTPTRHWSLLLSLDDNSFGILMQNFTLKITSLLNNQKGVTNRFFILTFVTKVKNVTSMK